MHIYDPDGIIHKRNQAQRELRRVIFFGLGTVSVLVVLVLLAVGR